MNKPTWINGCYNLNCKHNDGSQGCLLGNSDITVMINCDGMCMEFEPDMEYINRGINE